MYGFLRHVIPTDFRAVFRLFRTIDFILAAKNALSEPDIIVRFVKVFDNLFKALRMLIDNIHWAIKIGVSISPLFGRYYF